MTSTSVDRLDGLSSSTAIKGPCRVATTANITLSGLQTIDGVALAADDRVLVKDQSTGSQNGIYIASTGAWRRAKDFSRNDDVRQGTQVFVTSGTLYANSTWHVTTANPIVIGTTSIAFGGASANTGLLFHAATTTVLASLDTATYAAAVLTQAGREGVFIRVTASDYTAAIAADTLKGMFVPSTFSATYAWMRADVTELDVRWFGAVANGADTLDGWLVVRGSWVTATSYAVGDLAWNGGLGYKCISAHTSGTFATDLAAARWVLGAFSGTDNTAAFQGAIALHEATGIPILVPEGKYRLANPSTTVDAAYLSLTGQVFDMEGRGEAWLLLDEDGTAGKNYNLFKTDTAASNTNYNERREFRIENIRIRGRWSHKPGGNVPDSRAHVFYVSGYTDLIIDNCWFEDIAGSVSRIRSCDSVFCENSYAGRIAKGAFRFLDCNNQRVVDNIIEHTDDDGIDCHAYNTGLRTNVVITGNHLIGCEGIIALGAINTVVANNTLDYCHGTIIYVGGRAGDEGDNAPLNIVASNNVIRNALNRSNNGTTIIGASLNGALTVAGVASSILGGSYNGSSAVIDPIALDDYINIDLDTTDVPQGVGFVVSGNSIIRTRPAVATYSLWGVGLFFYQTGWINPAITEASFLENGIALLSDIENVAVTGNTISGFRSGAGIMLRFMSSGDDRHWAFRGVGIKGNSIRDCHDGVESSITFGSAATINIGVDIDGNIIDLDPYCISAARTDATSGRWNSGATNDQKSFGISLGNCQGYSVRNNTFKNLWEPIYNDATRVLGFYSGNLVICQPASGGHAYVSTNAGVGTPGRGGGGFHHMIEDCTPTSATFGQMLNACPSEATSVPSAGWAMAGQFIRNTNPTIDGNNMVILGWSRLLTTNAWVSGTDYAIVRASTVSPAT